MEICREDLTAADVAEIVAASTASGGAEAESSDATHLVSGQFERDHSGRFPEDKYSEDYVDRPFGFLPCPPK